MKLKAVEDKRDKLEERIDDYMDKHTRAIDDYEDHPCHCGSINCVGYIVAEEDWPKLKRRLKYHGKDTFSKVWGMDQQDIWPEIEWDYA